MTMTIQQELDALFSGAMTETLSAPAAGELWPAVVKQTQKPEFGHYQANGIMAAAKKSSLNPRSLAEDVVKRLDSHPMISNLEVAGPGFINIHLAEDFLVERLKRLREGSTLGVSKPAPETIVIDYSAPNLAKEMHIGHLRSTTIGDCLARVFEFMGHQVIRANHMGDWGSQFGSLLAYMHSLSNDPSQLSSKLEDLESFYQQASKLFKEDPDFASTAREYVVRLQGGDPDCLTLWQGFIQVSIAHCQSIYEALNITLQAADIQGESFYKDLLPGVVEDLTQAGMLVESDGALCVFLDEFKAKDGSPLAAIIKKSDGGYPYLATDLAAVKYRSRHLSATRACYFIDSRQSLHLQQLFAISRKVGYLNADQDFRHLANGTIMGDDGKPFKTRSGGVVKLADVVTEAKSRAAALIGERSTNLSEDERYRIADVVAVGAIKYAELSKNRTSDYIFNWNSMLSFEGDTAPYLQYAYTRIQSIFKSADVSADDIDFAMNLQQDAEKRLAVKLLQFPEALHAVTVDCMPNLLCKYLYELAGLFMAFYEHCPVLRSPPATRHSRLVLCNITASVLKGGLELLGIDVVDRM